MGRRTLFLAAGHGGKDKGNTSAGIVEADELIRFTAGVRGWFSRNAIPDALGGAMFVPDSLDLVGQLQWVRFWKPNAADGDLAIDFHLDYNANRPTGGALVIHNDHSVAQSFAERFLTGWCKRTSIKSNGVHLGRDVAMKWRGWDDFGWTARPWPAVIIELGSLNCHWDMVTIRDPLAQAVAARLVWETFAQ